MQYAQSGKGVTFSTKKNKYLDGCVWVPRQNLINLPHRQTVAHNQELLSGVSLGPDSSYFNMII